MTEIDRARFPSTWRYVHNQGYGGVIMVPCRVIKRTPKRMKIAALMKDGTEKIVYVLPGNIR
jgi:hypothetical protein